jgi:predicted site-specific integrase-resolvase
MVKEMIASKMEELTKMLLEVLDELCRIFGNALEKADKEKKEQDKVQKDMFDALESSYAMMQNKVSDEVQKVIDMLGGMMAPPQEDEEDEEDDDDDDEEA